MEEEIIEIDCAECENNRIKHKAVVLDRRETDNKEIIEFQCKDCNSKGILTRYKTSQIEILDYFPD
ncbi:MAG: hypothetical protein R6U44_05025 [Archaeoglobaceae archaeon]